MATQRQGIGVKQATKAPKTVSEACVLAMGAAIGVLVDALKDRSERDAALIAKMADQLASNSDYQIKRLEIEAQIAESGAKAHVARTFIHANPEMVHQNGTGGALDEGETPVFSTNPR